MGAASGGQSPDLRVDCPGQVGDQGGTVAVVAVHQAVGHRERARHRDLDRMVRGRLGDPPVVWQERLAGGHRAGHRRQDRRHRPATYLGLDAVLEVDTREVSAVVVDVVLPADLAVGHDVDARVGLVRNHLGGRTHEQRLGLCPGSLHLVGPAGGEVLIRQVEPV